MKIPETYEEFLKTPKDDLKKIACADLSLNEAIQMVKYLNQLENEGNKILNEEKNSFSKSTYWEDLHGDLK